MDGKEWEGGRGKGQEGGRAGYSTVREGYEGGWDELGRGREVGAI